MSARTRVVLLGTAGGPALRPGRFSPASAVVAEGRAYLVDCGYGVGRRMVEAGIGFDSLRAIFVTHQHSDHNADLGNLLVLGWATGLKQRVEVYGPPRTAELVDLALRYHAYDIAVRVADEGRPEPRPLFSAHEFTDPAVIYRDDAVIVEAALVEHPPVVPAFAYKFTTADRVVVFSGDTAYHPPLADFARDADLLVHEVLLPSALDRLLARVPTATRLREHILASHTTAEDVGRIAASAGVKHLALTHFVPSYDPTLNDADWSEPVARFYAGDIVVGRDLSEV